MITITEAEQAVRDALGVSWSVVKLGGYWLVYVSGSRTQHVQSRSLPRAIAMARQS